MAKSPSNGFVAFIAGLALTAAAALPVSFAAFLLLPGMFIAMAVGAGSFHEPGKAGPLATLAVIYGGSSVIWSVLVYTALRLLERRRAA